VSITSVDGLVSGLNTTQIVSQLMQIEARQQTSLKASLKSQQDVTGAYRSINAKLAALRDAAAALTGTAGWQPVAAASSSDAVTATATAGTAVGSLTFNVTTLAKRQVLTTVLPADGPASTGSGLDVSIGGQPPTHLDIDTDTPQGVADALNAADLGVRAALLTTDQGTVLQLTATKTGSAAAFTVAGLAGTPQVLSPGTDAVITVGNPAAGGYTVTSPTNTITGVPPGVTMTAIREQTGVTVSVTADAGSIADRMQTLVTAANAALTEIGARTAYQPGNTAGGPLTGDGQVRRIQQQLLSSVSNGLAGYGAFRQLGVQLDTSGALTFDRTAFLAAYAADPASTRSAVSTGLAASLQAVTRSATDPGTGSLTMAVQGGSAAERRLTGEIADWDVRLTARQTALQRQYSRLEQVLGKLKDQSNWLAGQLSGLTNNSG
jgi:flagellar hook-associated protein 2